MTRPVELITPGSWHDSVGDIALMQATMQQLSLRGIPTIARCEALNPDAPCVIGGGRLLAPIQIKEWKDILAPYQIQGPHLLNSVQVTGSGDFSFLEHHQYVAVRDQRSFEAVRDFCDPVLAPCMATLLEKPRLDYIRHLPGMKFLRELDADYVVVDRGFRDEPDSGPFESITVTTRPWERRLDPRPSKHRNPDIVLGIVAGAKAVLCSSLHLSIFALAMGVPFACYEKSPNGKINGYWQRAGFSSVVTDSQEGLFDLAMAHEQVMEEVREVEISRASAHADRMARILDPNRF